MEWSKYAKIYDPIKIGSIDGKLYFCYLNTLSFYCDQKTVNMFLNNTQTKLSICYFLQGTDSEPHDRAVIRAQHSRYKPNDKINGNERHTIFVARLHNKTDEVVVIIRFSNFLAHNNLNTFVGKTKRQISKIW